MEENTNTQENEVSDETQGTAGQDTKPVSKFAIVITWAEGHGPENESDAADAKQVCDEFYAQDFGDDEMPTSINAITVKRI